MLARTMWLGRTLRRHPRAGHPVGPDASRDTSPVGWADLRLAVRLLAIFSIVEAVRLRPLPFRDPDRLVHIVEANPGRGTERAPVSA